MAYFCTICGTLWSMFATGRRYRTGKNRNCPDCVKMFNAKNGITNKGERAKK